MLKHLTIRNYALIENLNIDIGTGLTIITGETGAGKSILLGALSLIMGNRADRSVLMDEEKKCIVEAVIDVSGYDMKALFEELDLDFEPETIIRREISANGKSRSFVNDTPINLNDLKEITGQLIDIHSQHETVMLNQQGYQLKMLDSFASISAEKSEYRDVFNNWQRANNELIELEERMKKDDLEHDYLDHQYQELITADLKEGEESELREELKMLGNVEHIKLALNNALAKLESDDINILSLLGDIQKEVDDVSKFTNKAANLSERVTSSLIELVDVKNELEKMQEELNLDPEKLSFLEERMNIINSLQHKHKLSSVEELMQLREDLSARLGNEMDNSLRIEKLKNETQKLKSEVMSLGELIHEKRKEAAIVLKGEIESSLAELGMKDAVLAIELEKQEIPQSSGLDKVLFMFSANKGISGKALNKIASGGELSRLMLSIKSSVARKMSLPTIIFDEIDSGISGEIADKTGEIVKRLSSNTQVICITHLPQMASKGNHHLKVLKNTAVTPPRTEIVSLNKEARVKEIAKMLSGERLTEQAIENAKVLLND